MRAALTKSLTGYELEPDREESVQPESESCYMLAVFKTVLKLLQKEKIQKQEHKSFKKF